MCVCVVGSKRAAVQHSTVGQNNSSHADSFDNSHTYTLDAYAHTVLHQQAYLSAFREHIHKSEVGVGWGGGVCGEGVCVQKKKKYDSLSS